MIKKGGFESVRQPCDPSRSVELGRERSSTAKDDAHIILAFNHALITRSWFIHQTYVPVSLEIKDTVVRSYRTDPVQVRSCFEVLSSRYINIWVLLLLSDVGLTSCLLLQLSALGFRYKMLFKSCNLSRLCSKT